MKQLKFLLLLGATGFMLPSLSAVETISKVAGTNPFTANITATVFDRYDGTLYVGLAVTEAGGYEISSAGRAASAFTALDTTGAIAAGINHDSLRLLRTSGTRSTGSVVESAADYLTFVANTATSSTALSALNLSNNARVNVTLPATNLFVKDATATVNASHLSMVETASADIFIRTIGHTIRFSREATTSSHGLAHYRLNTANALVRVKEDNHLSRFLPIDVVMQGTTGAVNAEVLDMHWCTSLERLFIALSITGSNANATFQNYTRVPLAIVKGNMDSGALVLESVCSFTPATAGDTHSIFTYLGSAAPGASLTAQADTNLTISIHKVRTMETSTGQMYLIVNGSANALNMQDKNVVYSLRLSSTGNIVRNNTVTNGIYTANEFFNGGVNGQIRTNAINQTFAGGLDSVPGVTVGNEALPWENGLTSSVDHMEIIGDAVYVSRVVPRDGTNDPGVWCSQAQFDSYGTITGWTNWERVFPSLNTQADDTRFFAIDGYNGRVWQVQRDSRNIKRSEWTTSSFGATSLPYALNQDIGGCASCVLDLPIKTPGIHDIQGAASYIHTSLALFGGLEKVIFAMTKHDNANAITTDFTSALYYLSTPLPSGAGLTRCLGYSRYDNNAGLFGYFFAGCEGGLYVYANPTAPYAGFPPGQATGISLLNAVPFTTFAWRPMASTQITGAVSQIESDMRDIYVVEQDITTQGGITSKLWKITILANVTAMDAAPAVLIAQSGSEGIPANAVFTGFRLITDNQGNLSTHRGILSTNAGLYRSGTALTNLAAVGNNGATPWTGIETTKAYHSLYSPKRRTTAALPNDDGILHKTWSIPLYDGSGLSYYQDSEFRQLESDSFPVLQAATTGDRAHTNGKLVGGTALTYLTDRSLYFYSDGGRRIFTRFAASETANNAARFFPYLAREWAMTLPVAESALSSITRINWIENISGLGMILMGTNAGVISLE